MNRSLDELELPIEDPEFFYGDTRPVLEALLSETELCYYSPLDMWIASRYDDVRYIGRSPNLFPSDDGILLNDFRYGDVVKSFFPDGAEVFALENPPRHTELRRVMIPPFGPQSVARMEDITRRVCVERVSQIVAGDAFSFSRLLAEPIPLSVIALLIGLPLEDLGQIQVWSDATIDMSAAADAEALKAFAKSLEPMYEYFEGKLAERRANPQDDMLTALGAAHQSGKISLETVHMMLSGILAAGNETARSTMNGAIIALAQHPLEMNKLVADPRRVAVAVEEFLRWTTPVRGFGRTVATDTQIRSTTLHKGQRIFMFYSAANRDDQVFDRPFEFDVARTMDRPHLSFGFGQHTCIGATLARMEIRVLFEELVKRFHGVILESSERSHSLLLNAYNDVTVRCEA